MEAQPDSSEMAYHADSKAVAKVPTLDAEVDNKWIHMPQIRFRRDLDYLSGVIYNAYRAHASEVCCANMV